MNHLKTAAAMAMATAMALASTSAQGRDDGDDQGLIQLRVCNLSGDDALVAVSYIPVGESRFLNRGWFRVRPGDCSNIAETDNSNFYFYADVDGADMAWSGSHSLCVKYPGPYDFYSTSSDYCGSGQETRDFSAFSRSEPGTFIWNLDP